MPRGQRVEPGAQSQCRLATMFNRPLGKFVPRLHVAWKFCFFTAQIVGLVCGVHSGLGPVTSVASELCSASENHINGGTSLLSFLCSPIRVTNFAGIGGGSASSRSAAAPIPKSEQHAQMDEIEIRLQEGMENLRNVISTTYPDVLKSIASNAVDNLTRAVDLYHAALTVDFSKRQLVINYKLHAKC